MSYNRYSYLLNSPLNGTDPSGYGLGWLDPGGSQWRSVYSNAKGVLQNPFSVNSWNGLNHSLIGHGTIDNYILTHSWANALAHTVGTVVSLYCGGGAAACAGAINGAQESYQTWLRGGTYNDQFDAGFEAGVTGFIAAGINSNISGYYGNTWTASRVLVTSVAGGAISEMKGGSFASGFKTSFVLSSLTYGNYLMRENQVANASLNPDGSNIDGESAGFFGDGKKLAGARRTVGENGAYLRCDSLMGGCQGAPRLEDDVRSSFFGLPYPPGSIPDRINEAFAGPHDILRNLTGSYDALGNAVRFTGAMGVIDNVRNYALVIPAAPFAFAALVPTSSYDTIRSARDR